MTSKDILNALGGVGSDLIDDAAEPAAHAPRGGKRLRAAVTAAAAVLLTVGLVVTAVLIMNKPQDNVPEDTYALPLDAELWVDTREKKDFTPQEIAVVVPWEYLSVTDKYPYIEYNGVPYERLRRFSGNPEAQGLLTEKLASAKASGQDDYGIPHTERVDVYGIKGVDSARRVMVRYPEQDIWVVAQPERYTPPATLGELTESMSLPENMPLTALWLYDAEKSIGQRSTAYGLTDADSDALWEIFGAWADVPCDESASSNSVGRDVVSFGIYSDLLGVRNHSWSLTDGGYLHTNIDGYGYYFHIGTDAVETVRTYVEEHKTAPRPQADARQYICGTVTEIGDGWFVLDDSVSLKDPAQGMEFTVTAGEGRMRYFLEKQLKTGMVIAVEHEGIAADDPTVIRTAFDVRLGVVIKDGNVNVPE